MAGASPCTFWPPPPSTSMLVTSGGAARDATLGEVGDRATALLGDAGYDDVRWYPIGVGFQHGFALVTRLEDIEAAQDRWAASDREPPTLRWLAGARQPRFSRAGRYRALLFSFTDLPLPSSATADPWDEGTVMEGPGIPVGMRVGDVPKRWKVPNTFRWLLLRLRGAPPVEGFAERRNGPLRGTFDTGSKVRGRRRRCRRTSQRSSSACQRPWRLHRPRCRRASPRRGGARAARSLLGYPDQRSPGSLGVSTPSAGKTRCPSGLRFRPKRSSMMEKSRSGKARGGSLVRSPRGSRR